MSALRFTVFVFHVTLLVEIVTYPMFLLNYCSFDAHCTVSISIMTVGDEGHCPLAYGANGLLLTLLGAWNPERRTPLA